MLSICTQALDLAYVHAFSRKGGERVADAEVMPVYSSPVCDKLLQVMWYALELCLVKACRARGEISLEQKVCNSHVWLSLEGVAGYI